jgi:hypothetical protein
LLEAEEEVEYKPAEHPLHASQTVQPPVVKGKPNTCTSAMLRKAPVPKAGLCKKKYLPVATHVKGTIRGLPPGPLKQFTLPTPS